MRVATLLACILALAACFALAAPAAPVVDVAGADSGVDYGCKGDADCVVKDLGSCCGYSPACVNRASPTFPAQVRRDCAKNHTVGVCGFPVVEGCRCVEGRCSNRTGGGAQNR